MVKFNLRLNTTSRTKAELIKQEAKARKEQLRTAVQYCLDNNCRGCSAAKSGLFQGYKNH